MAPKSAAEIRAEVRREMARRSLIHFTLHTYPTYQAGWFHRDVAARLDRFLADVIALRSPRMMLFAPPRSGKTELVSRRFPAHALGRFPDLSIIATSYASELAQRNNRDVQRIMDDDEYQAMFPNTRLWSSNVRTTARGTWLRNSDIFEVVNHRGVYRAAGVMAGITGMGGQCLPGGTVVETSDGPVAIEKLWQAPGSVKVLSYDGRDGLRFSTIEAISRREAPRLYRVTTAAGRVVEATPEHPFFSGGRYVRADALAPGDRLMRLLPRGVREASVRDREGRAARPEGSLLFARLLGSAPRGQELLGLRGVRRQDELQAYALLRRLPTEAEGENEGTPVTVGHLPDVQRVIRHGVGDLLREGVRQPGSLAAHVGQGQPEVEAWCHALARAAALGEGVQGHATPGVEARRPAVRAVLVQGPAGGPPPRQLADEQCGLEPRHALLALPPTLARGEGREAVEDVVARVEEVGGPAVVYDLQVEGDHNFFANGALTHNCLIIDDPVKDALEADSKTYRDRLWDWYTSTLYTRRAPGAGILLIQTRWHEDDLAGRLLAAAKSGEGEQWDVVSYPAVAEKDEEHRKAGEPLHPERYDAEEMERTRLAVGTRVWSSLYQQRPTVAEGSIFKRENWGRFKWPGDFTMAPYDVVRMLGVTRVVQALDSAFKVKEQDDYSSLVTFGEVPDGWLVLDVFKRKLEYPELKRAVIDHAAKWQPTALVIEDKASGQSLIQEFKRETRLPVVAVKADNDKVARANSVTPLHESGRFKLPEGAPWVADFIDSLAAFPNGAHDDDVDAFVHGANYLARGGGATGMLEYMRGQYEAMLATKAARDAGTSAPSSAAPALAAPPPGAFAIALHSTAPMAVAAAAAVIRAAGGAGIVEVDGTYYVSPGAADPADLKFRILRGGYVRAA